MSALANTRAHQSSINKPAQDRVELTAVNKPATVISVIARIDYIQRFSKQMTVVVDKNTAVYSQLSRQYLASISQETGKQEINVAFVAASSKLNDIQIRCRLIEQLFANTLFDPEQSLAVSLSRLAKQNNDTIIVIVEHAQSLSLQIKYELCQLVDVAKKTQNNIHVVLFGLEQAAQEIAKNKSIFDKKTSIVDANSGQILALDHTRFKGKTEVFKSEPWIKISIMTLLSVLIITFIGLILIEYEQVNFASLPTRTPIIEQANVAPQTASITSKSQQLANVDDIYTALLGIKMQNILPTVAAERGDILQALALTEERVVNSESQSNIAKNIAVPDSKSSNLNVLNSIDSSVVSVSLVSDNKAYYLNSAKGYVVQITGFSESSQANQFINQHSNLELFTFQKKLNNQKFIALTTKIYTDKVTAIAVLNALPQSLKDLGAFLKSTSTIKQEINTFNR